MNNNNIFKNQKGVSLIIIFFILTITLAIVLSISLILYSQIKIIRNIGNSVVAFYAADSGVEKTLYYDRKQVPLGGQRGLCNICNACLGDCTPGLDGDPGDCVESKCQGCILTPLAVNGCDLLTCGNCEASFNSFFEDKNYEVKASVTPTPNSSSFTTGIDSRGNYKSVSRKIRLQTINP